MTKTILGQLVPAGGGDAIPLMGTTLRVGRRESCDICLRFPNISGTHCELSFKDGYWVIRDLDSTNGIKVNGQRLRFRPLRPGDKVTIGKRDYTINYDLQLAGQIALEAILAESENVYNQSLMEKAGLTKASRLDPFRMVDPTQRASDETEEDVEVDDDDD